MRLLNFTAPKSFYLLTFADNQPVWKLFASGGCEKVDKPGKNSRLPILAVIPDRYFFFYLCHNLQARNRKTMLQAARLQMKHIFPDQDQQHAPQVMDTGTHVLGIFRAKELESFIGQHRDNLALAGTVTTSFLLGLAVMPDQDQPEWVMRNPGDPVILLREDKLEYFSGDSSELEQRMKNQGPGCGLREVGFDELTSRLNSAAVPWSRLRLTLPELESGKGQAAALLKTALGVLVIGLLFCAGNFFNLRSIVQEKTQWQQELDTLYISSLGRDYGPDPYGMLLYRADQSAHSRNQGLDFLDLLGHLSRAAPQDLIVESLSLGMDSGSLRASLDSYDHMEKFLQDLKTSRKYDFTLDQADSSEDRISLVLSFRY